MVVALSVWRKGGGKGGRLYLTSVSSRWDISIRCRDPQQVASRHASKLSQCPNLLKSTAQARKDTIQKYAPMWSLHHRLQTAKAIRKQMFPCHQHLPPQRLLSTRTSSQEPTMPRAIYRTYIIPINCRETTQ